VAIGTGLTFREILRANPNGHNAGIDLAPAMLEKARLRAAKSGGTNYQISGDAYDLKFPNHQFDLGIRLSLESQVAGRMPEVLLLPAIRTVGFGNVHRETASQLGFLSEIILAMGSSK
jgi:SAM-dependent methyltransferase